MDEFVERHRQSIVGVLTGFDRLVFRGTLRSICYVEARIGFLNAHSILLKNFAAFVAKCTAQLECHARAVAQRAGRPYQYLTNPSLSKEHLARQIAAQLNVKQGLFCVFAAVEPCSSFDVYRDRESKRLRLVSRQRKCRFFYFYFIDREFGLMHIRLQSWLPFSIQVCLNGRSFLACQLHREQIAFTQADNTFTAIANLERAQQILDRLSRRDWRRTLNRWAERVNPLLATLGLTDDFGYYWTIRQSEIATDIMFRDRASLAAIYPDLCNHALQHFHSRDVMRFLSGQSRGPFAREVVTDKKERIEGVRIKHTVNGNSLKMYDKQGSVLRIETTINNPVSFQVLRGNSEGAAGALTWRPMRKGVSDTARRVAVSFAANRRYLQALAVVGEKTPSYQILDAVSVPVRKQGVRHRALRPITPQEAAHFEAILSGEHLLEGFTNQHIRERVFPASVGNEAERQRCSAHISRQLRILRAHGLIHKTGKRRRYRVTQRGQIVMTTALAFRKTDVALLMYKAA